MSKTPDNVVKLELVEVGEDYRFEPDALLEAAKGQGFTNLVIIGELPDAEEGDLWVSGMASAGQALILMERAKLKVIGR